MTEKFLAAHDGFLCSPSRQSVDKTVSRQKKSPGETQMNTATGNASRRALREGRCFLCDKVGHFARNCRTHSKPNQASVTTTTSSQKEVTAALCMEEEWLVTLSSGDKAPLVIGLGSTDSRMVPEDDFVNNEPVKVLRDTGCTGVGAGTSFVQSR